MKKPINYSVYLVTDRELMTSPTVEECVEQAILGGATLIQLREKHLDLGDFYNAALRVKALCSKYDVGLIINDRIDIALAIKADGVHIGQSDIPARIVRDIIGPDMILGVSATTLEEAEKAAQDGADYLGIGAMFYTGTKTDALVVSKETLQMITAAVDLPIVIIGGINENTIPLFDDCAIDGVAVVSAIVAKDNIKAAATTIKQLYYKNRQMTLCNKTLAMFDLDGTILDSLAVWQQVDEKYFHKMGLSIPADYFEQVASFDFKKTAEYTINRFQLTVSVEALMKEWFDMVQTEYCQSIQLKRGVKAYLETLQRENIQAVVVTSLPKELYQPVLKNNQIDHLFSQVFSVSERKGAKQDGTIYQCVLRTFHIDGNQAVLFEDEVTAMSAALKMGITVVGIRDYHNRTTCDCLRKNAHYVASDFIEVPRLHL